MHTQCERGVTAWFAFGLMNIFSWLHFLRLTTATQAAMALADVHNSDKEGQAAIAHTDISTGQFIFVHGTLKLNDFNRARFLLKKKNATGVNCPYFVSFNPGKVRSPEEYRYNPQSEKVDVFSFGHVLFAILDDHYPFHDVSSADTKTYVIENKMPALSAFLQDSKDSIEMALIEAIRMCYEWDQYKRSTARQISDFLRSAMQKYDPGTLETWGDA